jgi:dihydrofolate synthase/folylpolyglutamate synthase
MHTADLLHPNTTLQHKLEALYALRGGDSVIELGFRQPYLDLLAALGNPHLTLPPVIHVAGTNGKGSSIAILRAIYEAAGYKVHAYTSPHLLRFNERIVLAGQDIDNTMLENLIDEAITLNQGGSITFFEITTAIAFAAFSRSPADVVLLETGLGGRLDCTNVIQDPIATLITSISMDHQEFLGHTIDAIAKEKAGIMKPHAPCVIGAQRHVDALKVLKTHAKTLDVPTYCFDKAFHCEPHKPQNSGHFSFEIQNKEKTDKHININGLHQIRNASTALYAVHLLQNHLSVSETQIDAGLTQVNWPARLQPITSDATEIWYDGGHNEDAGYALAQWVTNQNHASQKPFHLIVGMKKEKDAHAFLAPLAKNAETIHIIPVPDVGAYLTASDLQNLPKATIDAKSIRGALDNIQSQSGSNTKKRILICGSLYLAKEISDTIKP